MEDDVWVEDAGVGMDVPESLYRERGYEPAVEKLPWKDDGDAELKARNK